MAERVTTWIEPSPLPDSLRGASVARRSHALMTWLQSAQYDDYIGEDVSQLAHSLQAATLARRRGDSELVLAALLHDLGHFAPSDRFEMTPLGRKHHEHVGADLLRGLGFSERVAELVAGHVDAKRYLVATRPSYCLLYTSPSPRDQRGSRMPSSA